MLARRLAVAAVGLPLLALLLAAPERLFGLAVAAMLGAAAYEMVRAALHEVSHATAIAAAASTALIVGLARGVEGFEPWTMLPPLAVALVILFRGDDRVAMAPLWWLTAVLYVGAPGSHFVLLRNLDDGTRWLVVMLAATFATDTGAYAVGRLLGRHALAPRISPGKTWEGAAGGALAGMLAGPGVLALLGLSPGAVAIAATAVGLPPAAQAGDLLESAIKRRLGVKDMSQWLPGHGGLLDRLDSLLLTGPLLYWIVRWFAT